jgi:transcription elongation GreA/GreB family factor
MTMTQISSELHAELEQELAQLVQIERPRLLALAASASGDPADEADRVNIEVELGMVDMRIDRIRLSLANADGQGGGGAVNVPVLLDFGSGPERAILDPIVWGDDDDVLPISGDSPAGIAITAAEAGQTVSYRAPSGREITVAVVAKGDQAFAAA